ncbi:hypothetical protein QE152_g15369 [Popillia japonica]|uniref:Uncharacterized protein n=1 Tax=Popillia japonica TaxID=7064 RepID=A0AAW1L5R3_POPJA
MATAREFAADEHARELLVPEPDQVEVETLIYKTDTTSAVLPPIVISSSSKSARQHQTKSNELVCEESVDSSRSRYRCD